MQRLLRTVIIFSTFTISFTVHAATHEIKMLNNGKDGIMAFDPPFLKANVGDVVKFVPTDPSHDVASVSIPSGAKSWRGEINKSVTTTLTKEGVYLYECPVHIAMAMIGVIQAGKATNLNTVKAAGKELSKKFVMNKERLDKYLSQVK